MSKNVWLGMGNLTADPEIIIGQNGNRRAKFRMAINEKYKSALGHTVEKTHFISCTAFGKTAEVIEKFTHKGQMILVQGKLDYSEWMDEATEKRRSNLAVVVQEVTLLPKAMNPGSRKSEHGEEPSEEEQRAVKAGAGATTSGKASPEDDDIPF